MLSEGGGHKLGGMEDGRWRMEGDVDAVGRWRSDGIVMAS